VFSWAVVVVIDFIITFRAYLVGPYVSAGRELLALCQVAGTRSSSPTASAASNCLKVTIVAMYN